MKSLRMAAISAILIVQSSHIWSQVPPTQPRTAISRAKAKVSLTQAQFQPYLVSRLIGLKVEDIDGERLGRVNNLVLDMQSGQPRYAIISSGGLLGIRAKHRVVPASILSIATAKKGTL